MMYSANPSKSESELHVNDATGATAAACWRTGYNC